MAFDWNYLERILEARGITKDALRKEFHFAPSNFKAWEKGTPARPHTLRKLARILNVDYLSLMKGLKVKVLTAKERRARAETKEEA